MGCTHYHQYDLRHFRTCQATAGSDEAVPKMTGSPDICRDLSHRWRPRSVAHKRAVICRASSGIKLGKCESLQVKLLPYRDVPSHSHGLRDFSGTRDVQNTSLLEFAQSVHRVGIYGNQVWALLFIQLKRIDKRISVRDSMARRMNYPECDVQQDPHR